MKRSNYISIQTTYEKLHPPGQSTLSIGDSNIKIQLACEKNEFALPNCDDVKKVTREFKSSVLKLSPNTPEDMFQHCIYLSTFGLPGVNITSDSIKCFAYLLLSLSLYDNLIDEDSNLTEVSYKDLKVLNKLIMDLLNDTELNTDTCDMLKFQTKMDIINLFQKFHKTANDQITNYKSINGRFLKLLDEHLQAQAWIRLDNTNYTTDTFLFRRERSVGTLLCLEFGKLVRGIEIEEEIENSILLQRFESCAVFSVMLVNDLFSWEREMHGSTGQNYFQAKLKEGSTIPLITTEIIQMINSNVAEMLRLASMMKTVFEDSNISRYTGHTRQHVDGNLFLHLTSPRYTFVKGLGNENLKCLEFKYID